MEVEQAIPGNWRAAVVPSGNHKGFKLGDLQPRTVKVLSHSKNTPAWFKAVCKKACAEMEI